MALYRLLQNLAFKDRTLARGSLSRLLSCKPDVIAKLKAKGGIAEVAPPPLAILPGWKIRANRLTKLGIITATEFLEAGDEEVMKAMRINQAALDKWRGEVEGWLVNPNKQVEG